MLTGTDKVMPEPCSALPEQENVTDELISLLREKNLASNEHKKVYNEFCCCRDKLLAIQKHIEELEVRINKVAPKYDEQTKIIGIN